MGAYNWELEPEEDGDGGETKSSTPSNCTAASTPSNQPNCRGCTEVSKCSPQEALQELGQGVQQLLERQEEVSQDRLPKFKSKKNGIGGFRLTGTIKVTEKGVQLPRLGVLKLKERGYLPTDAKILSATISERAGRWFVSVLVEVEQPEYTGTKDRRTWWVSIWVSRRWRPSRTARCMRTRRHSHHG